MASKCLLIYGVMMAVALGVTWALYINDERTLRDVNVWIKPMKFMAATALFAWTTVWAAHLANAAITHGQAYQGIAALLVVTSLFEVAYITYQGAQGAASHYNVSDPVHAMLFGLMGIAAVGLTASQAWLAWEIWSARDAGLSVTAWGVVVGLTLTFILSSVSGFLLGANQPPAGQGWPFLGWHLHRDIRPSHFLAVHAQQLIPLLGLLAERFLGAHSAWALGAGTGLYVLAWTWLSWASLSL